MKLPYIKIPRRAQTAVEYLLVFTVVAIVALAAFNKLLPNIYKSQSPQFSSDGFFSQVTRAIEGDAPKPIDGGLCPVDGAAGSGQTPTCECPAPAFGGKPCS